MPPPFRITVGLPVYNGANVIGQSLTALENQTCRDFICLIYDNASTDGTSEICAEIAARDPRFIYHRNEENVGGAQNFLDVLAAAETEYFLWRADDDFSSENFLELLQAQLDANPDAALAAPHVESRRPAKDRVKHAAYVARWPGPRIVNILRRMFLSHPSWIYGMWRTSALRRYYLGTWEKYPTGWANDHLVILNAILDDAVVGDDRVTFVQQIGARGDGSGGSATRPSRSKQIEVKSELQGTFRQHCRDAVAERDWSPVERLILNAVITSYADKRAKTSDFQLLRLKARRALLGEH